MEPPWVAYYNFKVEGFVVETIAWLEKAFSIPACVMSPFVVLNDFCA